MIKNHLKFNIAHIFVLIRYFIWGFFAGVFGLLGYFISNPVTQRIDENNFYIFLIVGIFIVVVMLCYLYVRRAFNELIKILKHFRFDIIFMFFVGILLTISFSDKILEIYGEFLGNLTLFQVGAIVGIFVLMALMSLFFFLVIYFKKDKPNEPFFISDLEEKRKKNDLLGVARIAENFANQIINGGSSDSIVFGIDAPWGVGKSSFLSFCIETWENDFSDDVIIYHFNPLRFEDRNNLLEKFIDGLVTVFKEKIFAPEIPYLVSKYARFLKWRARFSIWGMEINLTPGMSSPDDIIDDLEFVLKRIKQKIIIVVDDLDRLHLSAVKEILFTVKKSFSLPNISYVLCYDTENLINSGGKHDDAEKVREFLEKFVNVKINLFLSSKNIVNYITDNLEIVLKNNLQIDPRARDKIKETIGYVVEICNSEDFHLYVPFLGDIRKIKRLLNTLLVLDIHSTDFENSDFDKQDLLNLLLIYINYPNIFRKIYDTETNGKGKFFSLVTSMNLPSVRDNNYHNSKHYDSYLAELADDNQRFLVENIFTVSKRLNEVKVDRVDEILKKTLACFNSSTFWGEGRNLNDYLKLIVDTSKPTKTTQYRFYLTQKNKILKGEDIGTILSDQAFSFENGEDSHTQLFRIVVNSSFEFNKDNTDDIIKYLLKSISHYSVFSHEKIGLGFRDHVDYLMIKTLDSAGWEDKDHKHGDNTIENLGEIVEWIFGEGRHVDEGILSGLSPEEKGVLGLYDLLHFRLHCCLDRGGDIFNLKRALMKDGDSSYKDGDPDNLETEMRRISQKAFSIFKEQYIDKGKNFFKEVDKVSLEDMTGLSHDYLQGKIEAGVISTEEVEEKALQIKTIIKAFSVYQLASNVVGGGIGCG
ncbi:MAG: P-loop NTPase fold protein, partial [Candidatus Nomurabacteria bacterium]|nr:P-loop NTPase fold protein [Candidatus Nomurabacteria bacterium]